MEIVQLQTQQPELHRPGDSVGECGGEVTGLVAGAITVQVYPSPELCRHCSVLDCPQNISAEE